MVSKQELIVRIQEFLRFDKQEIIGYIAAIIVTAFVFSFRDWGGEVFDLIVGLQNLFIVLLIVGITFFFRAVCQKIYALTEGYNAEFRIWWVGLLLMLIIAFVSFGRIPLILIGATVASFMVRQRLGEFRYGFSYWNNFMISFWGPLANMILAILFSIGLYIFPQSYFFYKGLVFNLLMGLFSFLPLPQVGGLNIFFGSRKMYLLGIAMVFLAGILLLSRTLAGIIIAVVIALIIAIVYLATSSER